MSKAGLKAAKRNIPVKVEEPGAVAAEADRVHEKILNRAFEIFNETGSSFGHDLENWLAAEREIVWAPSVELRESGHVYTVEADVAGVDPADLDVQVTPNDVLITGETRREREERKGTVCYSEFSSGNLFRRVSFPGPIDTSKVEAVYKDGLLKLTAPTAATNGEAPVPATNGAPAR
jgi:HSP20 family protein